MNKLILLLTLSLCLWTQTSYANEQAIFSGGCFWTMQHYFDSVPGVVSTEAGYTGGNVANPSYEQVSTGKTGHLEAVKVVYDPKRIRYQDLLDFYWHHIDPTNSQGQFCDSGSEYKTAIFYTNQTQNRLAEQSMQTLQKSSGLKTFYTQIRPAQNFYPAENYHQHYADKNPLAYSQYRNACGRDASLNALWHSK